MCRASNPKTFIHIALAGLVAFETGCSTVVSCPLPPAAVDAASDDAGLGDGARSTPGDARVPEGAVLPQFYWDYAFGLESSCQRRAVAEIDSLPETGLLSQETYDLWLGSVADWTNEAIVFAPRLSAAWREQAPRLYRALLEVTGEPLVRERVSATVFVCLNENSNASPLSISIPYFLPAAGASLGRTTAWAEALGANDLTLPLPLDSFVEITFHELLHIYVMERLQTRRSQLIRDYADEGGLVQTHLHVFALQTAIYERLAAEDPASGAPLERSRRLYAATGARSYLRAWEIVEELGPEPFIAELLGPEVAAQCSFCSEEQWPTLGLVTQLYDTRF